jgi:vitamin B12 transporter
VFADDEWSPVENVFLTGGLRHDDFDTFGGATTGRATVAWLAVPKTLKLRASYGTGFNAPSFLDLYGVNQAYGYQGNPNLRPEHSRGWDAGADWYLPGKRGALSATWFQTDYTNLIEDTPDYSTTENIDRARTRGIELSAKTDLPCAVKARIAYTWLQAENLSASSELLRRPRNSASADLWHDFGRGVSAGAGVNYVGHRADIDALTYATVTDPTYTVVRVYAAWEVTKTFTLTARVENLLAKHYEPVNGYPALGRGVFGGAVWKF